ncbi:peptidase T [Mycoplasma sp. P36-A1]|uniref:peptidase T n=1 Tax=Mycoplasma sp. P36-A1 TaxID=3252900 RepID=UPI003C2E7C7F
MNNEKLLQRFISYTKVNTQSNPNSTTIPSTKEQKDLAKILKNQLQEMNLIVKEDSNGYLVATLKSNLDYKVDKIGFVAHIDTSSDYSGENVKAIIHRNYNGQDIVFKTGEVMSVERFNELKKYQNQTLITSDGTTLLGGDDKAGIAIIMEMLEYYSNNKAILHGDIIVAFTFDEEIGSGIDNFDLEYFKPDYAYTVDGGEIGELNYETFNAASLKVEIQGLNVHPGSAKNKMINSLEKAYEFHSMLPKADKPELTDNYQGFYMLTNMSGDVEKSILEYIIRDHNSDIFEYRKKYIYQIVEQMKKEQKDLQIEVTIKDQYYNMAIPILKNPKCVEIAKKAFIKNDITPNIKAIRGGTDGSKLSYDGILCPNIFTGGNNFHGRFEFTVLESMAKARDIIIDIVKIVSKQID